MRFAIAAQPCEPRESVTAGDQTFHTRDAFAALDLAAGGESAH
jgi:hypothetical protein